jgi:hypothetical protein
MLASGTPELRKFLHDYPLMAIRPSVEVHLRLKGRFAFMARHAKEGEIQDSFALQIDVPKAFPKDLPKVVETEGRIPRTGDFHIYSDGTLCLGSPLSILLKLSKFPTLVGFAENCLVPYLFAISRKLKSGGSLPFGELDHGSKGMLADYAQLFRLKRPEHAKFVLQLLGMKKRRANKLPCPCGCGIRLGRCKFNSRLREFRALASRKWFRMEHQAVA